MGGPHYYITYYYYRRAIVFFCDTAGLWRRGAVSSNMGAMPTSGICVCHYSRAVVAAAAAALLLQIVPIGTYTMSYYLTASRAKVSSVAGAGSRRPAAGDRFCSGYLLLLGVKVRM